MARRWTGAEDDLLLELYWRGYHANESPPPSNILGELRVSDRVELIR